MCDARAVRSRELLARAFEAGLAALDLEAAVARALARERIRPALVIAAGKAAPAMARGAARALGGLPETLAVVPDGLAVALPGVRVVRAGHPLPDARSVRAGERALAMASRREPLLVLLSGGASALLSAPSGSLADKRAVTRALLASGADVAAINTVRRHLSRIKGGRLAAAAAPAPVLALVVSDVLGGRPFEIGSGPTAGDPTTSRDARAVLRAFAPEHADVELSASIPPGSPRLARARTRIVLRPEDLARAVARALEARGLSPRILPPARGDVAALAARYVQLARTLGAGEAIVRAAEPTVAVTAARPGRGGRSTHLACLAGPALPPGVALLAGASDGVDGASGTGGAVVDRGTFAGLDPGVIAAAIAGFATGGLLESLGAALPGGPTGKNFADVHVLARPAR